MLIAHLAHAAAVRALNLNRHGTYSFTHQNQRGDPGGIGREGNSPSSSYPRAACPACENYLDFFPGLLGSSFMYRTNAAAQRSRFSSPPPPFSGEHIS
jgi:hypothetical protein